MGEFAQVGFGYILLVVFAMLRGGSKRLYLGPTDNFGPC
jgi:hypothetical protein